MLFPDEGLFDYVLIDLAEAITAHPAPPVQPLACDRYVARSCLQKAIRRAEPVLAQRALVNLFLHDRRSAWRALTIIALEDVGVANVDLLAKTVAAYRNRTWRTQMGGEWPVLAELARQMAGSLHCQAACDLLLRAMNDPTQEHARAAALEAAADTLAAQLWDRNAPPVGRAVAALALGGELSRGQQHRDPAAVFDIIAEAGRSSHIVATCQVAWRISRNPMSLLLPIVWEHWMSMGQACTVTDDPMPPVQMLGDVPGYALDQFTRIGNSVSRALLRDDESLKQILIEAEVPTGRQVRAVGDLLFISEGGLLANRARWAIGDQLRLPARKLPAVISLAEHLPRAVAHLAPKARQIALLRQQHFFPGKS